MGQDKFGINEIVPSKQGGQQWFMGDDLENDSRFDSKGDNLGGNATDGFSTTEADFRYNILTTKGYKTPDTLDHDRWIERGYICFPEDWRNIEFTAEIKYDGSDDFSLFCRSGKHTGDGNCEGTKYSVALNPDGDWRFAKETWHVNYDHRPWGSSGLGNIDNEWVRVKFIVYDVAAPSHPLGGRTDIVRLEFWTDPDFNNSWKMVGTFSDNGENWGSGGEKCGTGEQNGFLFGGPYATIRGDSVNQMWFRNVSVREIDKGGTTTQPPPTPQDPDPPPTNIPGTGAPQIDASSVGKDKFGVSILHPTPVGGWQWFNNWDNGVVYNNIAPATEPWFNPSDKYFSVEDRPNLTFSINGAGVMTVSNPTGTEDYRIKVFDLADSKRFLNVEATCYYNWTTIGSAPDNIDGTDTLRVGSDHHFSTRNCPYNAHEYMVNIRREGQIYFSREALHPNETMARPDPSWGVGGAQIWWDGSNNVPRPPTGVWVGFKLVKRLIDGGTNVLLELYRDMTDGSNGGDWQKLMEFKHISGNWTDILTAEREQAGIDLSFQHLTECRIPPSCDCDDPVHNHSGGMCYLRGSPVQTMRLKKLSFREITDADTPLPNQGTGCAPGYEKDAQGNCVPMQGGGGSGSVGDASIVYKDFVDVYHIGTNDADSCDITGVFPGDDLDIIYQVDETDESLELYNSFRTHAGIHVATTASTMMNGRGRKFRFFLKKFGLPTGKVIFTVNDGNGQFIYSIGDVESELITRDFEEYEFELLQNDEIFKLNYVVWITFQGGDPENFIRCAVKSGNPFDGNNTTAITYSPGTGREVEQDLDIAGVIWR